MPRGDGTGPRGKWSRGMGLSWGRGLGICCKINANPESKLAYLEAIQKEINSQIEAIRNSQKENG